ncbi:MAG: TonB-dependent receptor, partial [Bacteroidales bacterium]|nr:TonB-dependent receptor [Bacteroidales bacterium]
KLNKSLLLAFLAMVLMANTAFSQISFKGNVKDNENMPVPFANIAMYSAADTSVLKYGTITDLNGNYEFKSVAEDNYLLVVSFIGFKNLRDTLLVTKSTESALINNYTLENDALLLNAATIHESRVKIQSDKTSYSILPSDVKGSASALQLTTIVPQVIYDPVSEKISSASGKSVKILLNGMNANEIELKTIKPEHISKIEHYDIPPARYAEFGSVINIITKVREDGIAVGANLSTAFNTGFGNEMLYLKYNKGRSQIGVDYSLYHRNYKKNKVESSYDYLFDNTRMQRFQKSNSAFGYDDNYFNLTYINQKDEDYAVKIKLSPNFMTYHANNISQIDYLEGDESESRRGNEKKKSSVTGPSADIYLWKQLKNRQELALNIVGTGFITSNDYSNKEYGESGDLELDDNMIEKNRKLSIIGEVNYSAEFSKAKFNAGYSIEANKLNSTVENSFENVDYKTSFLKNYIYSELSGKSGKLSYKASLGLSNIRRETYTQQFNDWVFRPSAIVGYNFGKGGVLTFQYKMYSSEPSIAQLSNNRVYVTEHIIRQGNPELRHSISNEINLDWGWSSKFLDVKLSTIYRHTERPINTYFSQGDEYIVLASENGDWSKTYGAIYSGTIKPFNNNIISVRFQGQVLKTHLSSSLAGVYSHVYAPLWYQVNFQYKNWSAYYLGNIIGRSLNGPYLRTTENQSNINVAYTKGDLMVYASCYWFLTKSKYKTSTIPESLVKYSSFNWIDDNKSMIVVGIRYNLFKGKKYNEKSSKLQNADRDTGMF